VTARLRELQHAMVEALQSPRSLAESEETTAHAADIARGNDRLSPVEQIDVYREQFFLRHVDALREDFPGVVALVGDEVFWDLSEAYLAAHPPRSFTLRDLGASFAGWLLETSRDDRQLLSDMARLEWAVVDAFDARDVPPVDPEKLTSAGEAVESARLVLDPSLTLLALQHPVNRIRPRLLEGESVEPPHAEPTFLAVHRDHHEIDWLELEPSAFAILTRLRDGESLGLALDGVAAGLGEAEIESMGASIAGWFGTWVQSGLIRDLVLPT
jgi:hypothetical protein